MLTKIDDDNYEFKSADQSQFVQRHPGLNGMLLTKVKEDNEYYYAKINVNESHRIFDSSSDTVYKYQDMGEINDNEFNPKLTKDIREWGILKNLML